MSAQDTAEGAALATGVDQKADRHLLINGRLGPVVGAAA